MARYKLESCGLFVPVDQGERSEKYEMKLLESLYLASIEYPEVEYKLHLPDISTSNLYPAQLTAVLLAAAKHEQIIVVEEKRVRAGFLLGDGPGVGKSRTIAALMYENWLQGRKRSVWFTVSRDLHQSSEEAFRGIHAPTELELVPSWNLQRKPNAGKIPTAKEGVLFLTYASLEHAEESTTYQLLQRWLGSTDFDGLVVFDECHRLKNALNHDERQRSSIGKFLASFQRSYPNARILYSSATAVMEPWQFSYLPRLGLWSHDQLHKTVAGFIESTFLKNLYAVESLVCSLKRNGFCVSRTLSVENSPVKLKSAEVTDDFIELYDQCTDWWLSALRLFKEVLRSMSITPAEKRNKLGVFWMSCLNFFRAMSLSTKVGTVVELTKAAVENNQCVIIGVSTTQESAIRAKGKKLAYCHNVSTPSMLMDRTIKEKMHDLINNAGNDLMNDDIDLEECYDEMFEEDYAIDGPVQKEVWEKRRRCLEESYNRLVGFLPGIFIDLLRTNFGPKNVAEITGRVLMTTMKSLPQPSVDGYASLIEPRTKCSLDKASNESERKQFIDGKKKILILSEAGSTGISLHSDVSYENKLQRVHITAELGWSCDKIIQQLGRSNRNNQAIAPVYFIVVSKLPGELRFLSDIAKKLCLMGAAGQGDRRANDKRGFARYNVDNEMGMTALRLLSASIAMGKPEPPEVRVPTYNGDYWKDAKTALSRLGIPDLTRCSLKRFFNRMSLSKVNIGRAIVNHFEGIFTNIKNKSKSSVSNDLGLQRVVFPHERVVVLEKIELRDSLTKMPYNTQIDVIEASTGVSFEETRQMYRESGLPLNSSLVGWHLAPYMHEASRRDVHFVNEAVGGEYYLYSPYKPRERMTKEKIEKFLQGHTNVFEYGALYTWESLYDGVEKECVHKYFFGFCSNSECFEGVRKFVASMITGDLFRVWGILEARLGSDELKIRRLLLTDQNRMIYGIFIPYEIDRDILEHEFGVDLTKLRAK